MRSSGFPASVAEPCREPSHGHNIRWETTVWRERSTDITVRRQQGRTAGPSLQFSSTDNDHVALQDQFGEENEISPVRRRPRGGYKAIVCARPDNEDPGQPSFAAIDRAAREQGLETVHIPISGGIGEGALIRMEQVLKEMPRPIFGYCRSGGRAGSLYTAALEAMRR